MQLPSMNRLLTNLADVKNSAVIRKLTRKQPDQRTATGPPSFEVVTDSQRDSLQKRLRTVFSRLNITVKDAVRSIKRSIPIRARLTLRSGRVVTLGRSSASGESEELPRQRPTFRDISTALVEGTKKLASAFASMLVALVDGTKKLALAFASMLVGVGKMISPVQVILTEEYRKRVVVQKPQAVEKIGAFFVNVRKRRACSPEVEAAPSDKRESKLNVVTPSELEIELKSGRVLLLNAYGIRQARKKMKKAMVKAFPALYAVKTQEILDFSRNLATLLESGVPIIHALQILHNQTASGRFREVLEEMMDNLEQGATLSEACAKHPTVFNSLYIRLLRVGEETGSMETVLRSLIKQMIKDEALKSKIKSGMAYPSFILALGGGVVLMLVLFVMPTMEKIYTSNNMEVPTMLTVVIAFGDFLKEYALMLLIGCMGAGLLIVWYTGKVQSGIRVKDVFMMRLPVLGKVTLHGRLSRFCFQLAILLRAGIPITESFRMMIQSGDGVLLSDSLERVNIRVHSGESLAEAMQNDPLFPLMLTQMIEVGEMTGRLESNLEMVGSYYEEETDKSVGRLVATLGPGMMVVIGLIVGGVAVTMFSTIFSMYDNFG